MKKNNHMIKSCDSVAKPYNRAKAGIKIIERFECSLNRKLL